MSLKNRAGSCGCCGCDIFSFDDVLTAESGTSVIDGFTVIGKTLPFENYNVRFRAYFTGPLNGTYPKITIRLLKGDGTTHAEFTYEEGRDPYIIFRQEVTWNGVAIFEDSARGGTVDPSTLPSSVTDYLLFDHTLIVRRGGASWGANSPTFSGKAFAFDSLDSYYISVASGLTVTEQADEDLPTKRASCLSGCPIRVDGIDELESFGNLRVAVKREPVDDEFDFEVEVTASKIYQEPIDAACDFGYYEAYGYEGDDLSQPEKNTTCTNPVICPVTFPHYTTPIWQVENASSDVTLNATESSHEVRGNCVSVVRHGYVGEIEHRFDTVPESSGANEIGANVENAGDRALMWAYSPPSNPNGTPTDERYEPTSFVHEYVSGTLNDPTSYAAGTGPVFRQSAYPIEVETTVLATDDPCRRIVRASFSILGWWSGTNTTYYEVFAYRVDKVWNSGEATRRYYVQTNSNYQTTLKTTPKPNAVYGPPTNSSDSRIMWSAFTSVFEKEVDSWAHEPPIIDFDSTNLVSDPATWYLVKTVAPRAMLTTGVLDPGRFRVSVDYTKEAVENTSIAFRLRPHQSPIVPHP